MSPMSGARFNALLSLSDFVLTQTALPTVHMLRLAVE